MSDNEIVKRELALLKGEESEEKNITLKSKESLLLSQVNKLKRNTEYKKQFPLMEEMSLLLDFSDIEEMNKYFSNKANEKEKKAFRKYKTGLIASLSLDRDFKQGIVSQYSLRIDETDIPPLAITFGYKIETLKELFNNLAKNTAKQKDILLKESISKSENKMNPTPVETSEMVEDMEDEIEGMFDEL